MEELTSPELEAQAELIKQLPRNTVIGTAGNGVSRDELLRLNSFARTIIEITGKPTLASAMKWIQRQASQKQGGNHEV